MRLATLVRPSRATIPGSLFIYHAMHPHKNIRLAPSAYVGRQSYFATICCFARHKIFTDPRRCSWLLDVLRSESAARAFAIHAYCIMPDHFHFLAEGLESRSDFLNFVKCFKLKTSRVYVAETAQSLWQKKFFDHILRSDESLESVAWYIWMNPVRKGLANAVGVFPFAGSFTRLPARVTRPSVIWTPPSTAKLPASEGGRYSG